MSGPASGRGLALRVVSLVPSATETLIAWGIRPVAVTRFCERPELPAVGGTKDPDIDAVVALSPDLVVVNDEENRIEDAEALQAAGVAIAVLSIRTVDDVAPSLDQLRRQLGVCDEPAGSEPISAPPARPLPTARRLRAFVPIWRERRDGAVASYSTLNHDTYGSSLLDRIGVDNVFGDADERYPVVHPDEVRNRRPDVVLAPTEPYPFSDRQRDELAALVARPAPDRYLVVDGQDLFWWGVRTGPAMRRLAEAVGSLAGDHG